MKISEEVINKLGLYKISIGIGRSFILDLHIFLSAYKDMRDFCFLECDLTGEPCEYITIYNRKTKAHGYCTNEFLSDIPLTSAVDTLTTMFK